MVRKTTFGVITALLFLLLPLNAQILLFEDFPANSIFPDDYAGWTVINEPTANRHWIIDERGGLFCDGGYNLIYDPVKTEYAITPAFNLPEDVNYGVRFVWIANQMDLIDKGAYDFHIGVTENNGANWDIIWSASNQQDVEKSGVIFPWASWLENVSTVSLKDYKGKNIKLAFIYELIDPENENMVRIPQMRVLPHEPIDGPIVGGSASYDFGTCYLGVKQKSYQTLYLSNQGIGSLEITAVEGLDGTDFSTDLVVGEVSLTAQSTHEYYVYYTPTETGAASATLTIKTNGGDHVVTLSGSKRSVPLGYVLESFESKEFPPAGWEVNGGWALSSKARSGDYALTVFFENLAELTSPRLDLSGNGEYTVTFDYALVLSGNEDYSSQTEFYLVQSTNGITFTDVIWTNSNLGDLEYSNPVTVSLKSGSDNSYLRWVYRIQGSLGMEDAAYQTVYLDNIVYPTPYGTNQKPFATSAVSPKNGATNQEVNELNLNWRGVVHATGYRIYLGKDANSLEQIADVDAAETPVKEVNGLDYNTTYYWKVVPYNNYGEADGVSVWSFTTMTDQSIKTFPYFQGFEGGEFPELGWKIINSENLGRGWDRTDWNAYNGKYTAYASGGVSEDVRVHSILQSPEIFLPGDKDMQITFVWGNRVPAGLSKAPAIEKSNEEEITGDRLYFEVKTPTTDWEVLTYARSTTNWEKEKVLLNKYKGQRITVRWRLQVENARFATGAGLDDIQISVLSDVGVPVITCRETYKGKNVYRDKWNAGVLNYKQTYNSGKIFTLANEGEYDLKIKSVSFSTDFFDTSLGVGMEIKANANIEFDMSFVALEHQLVIEDALHIEFEDGQTYDFPIEASALGATSYCYTFDDAPAFAVNDFSGFKTLAQGTSATIDFETSSFPNKGGSYAYMVMNYDEADFHIAVPRSGKQTLITSGPDANVEKISWLISPQVKPLENAQLRFYAKTLNEFWGKQYLTVLVSTTDNQVNSFVAVPSFTYVHIAEIMSDPYTEYIVDLSQYAGQDIYVAFKHETLNGYVMVMDDIYFENFAFPNAGEQKPVFMTEPIKEAWVGENYTYSFTIRDLDDDNMTVTIKGKPSWMTYTEIENEPGRLIGTLSGVPTSVDNYLIRIEVTDSVNENYQEYELKVTDVDAIESIHSQVSIYPNPATDILVLEGFTEGTVTLTDLTGKVVYINSNITEVPVADLAVGMYILQVSTSKGIYTNTIIKK